MNILTGVLSSLAPKLIQGFGSVAGHLLKDVGQGKIHSFKDFGRNLARQIGYTLSGDRSSGSRERLYQPGAMMRQFPGQVVLSEKPPPKPQGRMTRVSNNPTLGTTRMAKLMSILDEM